LGEFWDIRHQKQTEEANAAHIQRIFKILYDNHSIFNGEEEWSDNSYG
jgi:hypothetical protein